MNINAGHGDDKPLLYFQQRCRGGLRPPPTTIEAPPLPTRVSTAGLPSLNSHSLGNEAIFCHQRHKALTNEDGMCSWLQAQALPASATNSAPSLKLRCIEQQAMGTSEDAGSAVLSPPCARVCLQMQLPELWVGLGWVLGAPKWGLQELDGVWEGCRASSSSRPAAPMRLQLEHPQRVLPEVSPLTRTRSDHFVSFLGTKPPQTGIPL